MTSTLIELASMRHLSTVVIDLCNALSPETDPVSISSYNYFKVCPLLPTVRLYGYLDLEQLVSS